MKVRDEFKAHELNEMGMAKAQAIRELFSNALTHLESLVPAGRYRAMLATDLERAQMIAENQVAD
jgi:hypothetical protein